jgi:phosphate starvation-inducible PhoH-like protein
VKRRPKDWKTYDVPKQEDKKTFQFIPKNDEQRLLIRTIRDNQITLAEGCAGIGKTAVSIALAMEYLNKGQVDKIILSRPAIEAGDKLGHLPGDLEEKLYPYLLPLYDELLKYINRAELDMYKRQGIIEIAPIPYLRGRTFNNSFIILDESQNLDFKQLKMVLTRIGSNSKMVIQGDAEQSDLPDWRQGGLEDCMEKLQNTPGIGIIYLEGKDIVRNPLIGTILDKLNEEEKNPYDRKSFAKY